MGSFIAKYFCLISIYRQKLFFIDIFLYKGVWSPTIGARAISSRWKIRLWSLHLSWPQNGSTCIRNATDTYEKIYIYRVVQKYIKTRQTQLEKHICDITIFVKTKNSLMYFTWLWRDN